jgi:hypothetical protein
MGDPMGEPGGCLLLGRLGDGPPVGADHHYHQLQAGLVQGHSAVAEQPQAVVGALRAASVHRQPEPLLRVCGRVVHCRCCRFWQRWWASGVKVRVRWAAELVHWLPAWRPQGALEDCLVRLVGVLVRPAWLRLLQMGAVQEPLAWRPQVVWPQLQMPMPAAVQAPPV